MDLSNIFPFGVDNKFPDNGLITQSYDSRVNQNDMRSVSARLMKQGDAYYREETIDGSGKYSWNLDFISRLDSAFATGVIPNFSKQERKLFDGYMTFAKDGLLPTTPEDVKQLDAYMGSR